MKTEIEQLLRSVDENVLSLSEKRRKLGIPSRSADGYDEFDDPVKTPGCGNVDERKVELLEDCHRAYADIINLEAKLKDAEWRIKNISYSVECSFETEYDQRIFKRAWMYQAKFIFKSEHYDVRYAKPEYKDEYDKVVELFRRITSGMDCHNFRLIFSHGDDYSVLEFTVAGCPGTFEIFFPLVPEGLWHQREPRLNERRTPMQMTLAWRQDFMIPHKDYFFGGFSTYHLSDIAPKLKEFLESEKWKEYFPWLDREKYERKLTESKGDAVELPSDADYAYCRKILNDEIERCGRETRIKAVEN